MNTKAATTISLVALLASSLVGVAILHNASAQQTQSLVLGKKPTDPGNGGGGPKSGNAKVLVMVKGIPSGTTQLIAALQVGSNAPVQKVVNINETDTEAGIMFNKLDAHKGDAFVVTVNGATASGTLKDVRGAPTKVTVSLS